MSLFKHVASCTTILRLRLGTMFAFVFFCFFFFFFFSRVYETCSYCSCTVHEQQPQNLTFLTFFSRCALFMDPQISFFSNFFIKNGSYGTIHTFKNFFVTVFFNFQFQFSALSKRILNFIESMSLFKHVVSCTSLLWHKFRSWTLGLKGCVLKKKKITLYHFKLYTILYFAP